MPLVKAGNRRIDGWLCVKEYLKVDEGGPRMVFFDTCKPILRCLPLLQHDAGKPGDAATKPHDITHSPDALRYWCARRKISPEANAPAKKNPFERLRPKKDGVEEAYLVGGFEG